MSRMNTRASGRAALVKALSALSCTTHPVALGFKQARQCPPSVPIVVNEHELRQLTAPRCKLRRAYLAKPFINRKTEVMLLNAARMVLPSIEVVLDLQQGCFPHAQLAGDQRSAREPQHEMLRCHPSSTEHGIGAWTRPSKHAPGSD